MSFTSAHIIPGLFLFGFCFIENNPHACITLITLSLGFNGAAVMTSGQNPQDLAPNFAASVFGLTNFFATMSGFLSPLVVSYFTRDDQVSKSFNTQKLSIKFPFLEHDDRVAEGFHPRWYDLHLLRNLLYVLR